MKINTFPDFGNKEFIYPDGYAGRCNYDAVELSCLIRKKNNSPVFQVVNPSKRSKMSTSEKKPEQAWFNDWKRI